MVDPDHGVVVVLAHRALSVPGTAVVWVAAGDPTRPSDNRSEDGEHNDDSGDDKRGFGRHGEPPWPMRCMH
jgi:hypothetical protein